MWNVVSGNRLIDKRRKQEAQRKHLRALHQIKPIVNTQPPPQYSFLYSKPKTQQIKQDRQADIESQNTILIQKMMHTASFSKSRKQAFFKDSLNDIYRSRVSRQIDDGNQKMVKRLQSAKSQYCSVQKSIRQYEKYKSSMAYERMDPYYDMEYQTAEVQKKEKKLTRPMSAKH